ncbi:58a9a6db-6cae-4768-9d0e-0ee4d0b8d31d-CDS [Sclerotinia trifoliorum]|uniref:58a9a6db-6cae-4768-9d0e-0ee4d0b8d31d-CDS n=1 Tax=Sclerotinia trifoliorum TaxID=28548 RepID=A0A8H2VMD7_9HELO|nr:58a9a6db-6cae-4768-9d0e-0ee4d0b8d31d-CDS [Sclerotinia trifoliorum]
MTAQDYYSHSPQTVPGPGRFKRTTGSGYPTSTYHQQPQSDIPGNQGPDNPPPAVYNSQGYSSEQSYYQPQRQIADHNHQPQHYNYQTSNQPPYHGDEHHQYPAVGTQSSQHLPPHLRPRRSISEPPDPRYLAQHIPGYHHRGRSRSPSYYSSPERSPSRSRNRAHPHSRAHSTRSLSRDRRSHSHSRSQNPRSSRAQARHDHKDRNTFLGAFGGGAIGDLIMPGLGTLGGALLGGVGGREVSRNGRRNEKTGRKEGRRILGGSRKTYDQEWREGRIERGEISE